MHVGWLGLLLVMRPCSLITYKLSGAKRASWYSAATALKVQEQAPQAVLHDARRAGAQPPVESVGLAG